MASSLAQTESAAASGSSELLIRDPEVPALVDAITQTTPHKMAVQSEDGILKGLKADNNPQKRKPESAIPESVPARRSLRLSMLQNRGLARANYSK
ncbi:hypothetical protein GB937_009864 [Aspergillus fischeri]|nr:hypothetical protein GB937_009864 [Aspergillus fischeri]